MRVLEVAVKNGPNYGIFIKNNIFEDFGEYACENFRGRKIAIITDHNVQRLYGEELSNTIAAQNIQHSFITIGPGEKSKSMSTLMTIYNELTQLNIDRKDWILAFGGGVVGDLGGFAASTYLRGIPYIQFPTTLLAQVDSSIGGKTAIDMPWGKNLVGSFYHPNKVFIDPQLLKTLDKRVFHDGLAEVIKYGCIKDERLFSTLSGYKDEYELLENIDNIIYSCCTAKKILVEMDERDQGERMLLNFGHTLGHAIEKYFNYEGYTHGEAVAIGMAEITRRSEALSITQKGTAKLIEELLKKYQLTHEMPAINRKDLLDSVRLDKKSEGGSINLVMLKKIGQSLIHKVSMEKIEEYL